MQSSVGQGSHCNHCERLFSRTEPSEKLKGLLAAGLKAFLGDLQQFARIFAWKKCRREDFCLRNWKICRSKKQGMISEGALIMQCKRKIIWYHSETNMLMEQLHLMMVEDLQVRKGLPWTSLHFREVCIVGIGDDGKSLFPKITAVYQEAAKKVLRGGKGGEMLCLTRDGQYLDLHPLLFLRPQEEDWGKRAFLYNDLREKEANMLEYDACGRWRDESMRKDLLGAPNWLEKAYRF